MMKKYLNNILEKNTIVKVVFIIISILTIYMVSFYLIHNGNLQDKKYKFSYEEKNNIDYIVHIDENEFYDSNTLAKGSKYISSLINNIEITFDHKIISMDLFNIDSTYKIIARLEASEKNKHEILWSKEYNILDTSKPSNLSSTNEYSILKKVSIDYQYYKNIMNDYKNTYSLNIDGILYVDLILNSNIKCNTVESAFNNKKILSVKIPLLEQLVSIDTINDVDSKLSKELPYNSSHQPENYIEVTAGFVLFTISSLFLCFNILVIIYAYKNRNKYKCYIKSILKNYSEIIVESKTLPNIKGKELFEISNIDDLLDIQNELHEPIVYYNSHDEDISLFIINLVDRIYKLVIKASDF